eukprot:Rhum_TRINITY_DN14546_c0_g1::Rhum_TRINITY_DN14546_c0_g1_i1::g.96565::m.96565
MCHRFGLVPRVSRGLCVLPSVREQRGSRGSDGAKCGTGGREGTWPAWVELLACLRVASPLHEEWLECRLSQRPRLSGGQPVVALQMTICGSLYHHHHHTSCPPHPPMNRILFVSNGLPTLRLSRWGRVHMSGASGLYVKHGGQRYEVLSTQVTCYGAVTVLSHIRGEAFKRAYGREAPADVVRILEAKAAAEAAAAKAAKQKKLAVLGARKGERELAEYKAHRAKLQERGVAGRCLYFASVDGEGVLRFDCSACGKFVPIQAFRGHVTLAEHSRALAAAGLSEDYAFHARQEDTCLDAERQSSQHCEVCTKWITKGNWDDHCAGRAHLQAAAVAAVRSLVKKATPPAPSTVRQGVAGRAAAPAAASQCLQPLTKKARGKQNKRERESAEY